MQRWNMLCVLSSSGNNGGLAVGSTQGFGDCFSRPKRRDTRESSQAVSGDAVISTRTAMPFSRSSDTHKPAVHPSKSTLFSTARQQDAEQSNADSSGSGARLEERPLDGERALGRSPRIWY